MKQQQKATIVQSQEIKLSEITTNDGQIPGLPKNPRVIKDKSFEKLKNSIRELPEMIGLRELLVYPYITDGGCEKYCIIGGNMRYRAMKDLGFKTAPCKVMDPQTDLKVLRAVLLRDNSNYGEWDLNELANNFDLPELDAADIDLPPIDDTQNLDEEAEEDNYNVDNNIPEQPKSKLGDIYVLGNHRLICGDSTKQQFIDALTRGEQVDCIITDPPYNVNYEGGNGLKIENDQMEDHAFLSFLVAAFKTGNEALKPGGAFYIWHADREGYNVRRACKEVEWKIRETLIWVKNSIVLGRQDYQCRHEPCQPAGTMVLTTEGPKPIEILTEADRVISFDKYSGQIKGYKNGGYAIKTASRDYDGQMYYISAGGKTTRATDNHQFSVRFNHDASQRYCTYLMRRGKWWRVGMAKTYDARQFGLKTRIHQEHGEEAWIISTHEDKVEAQVMEQILTCKYGIPYTVWETTEIQRQMLRTDEQVKKIYDSLDLEEMEKNAEKLLQDFGRNRRYPLVTQESSSEKFNRRVTARIHACNLIPGLMQVPVADIPGVYPNFKWEDITSVENKREKCKVYSLAVDKYEHYISDGIVTHNCLYGWKDGAGHYFINRRDLATIIDESQNMDLDAMSKSDMKELLKTMLNPDAVPTTTIYENKPLKNDVHPTMKPLKLIGRQIRNSTRPGETVLDLFGGSGSTMMAAEQLNRKCFMVEFDPKYVDVIINRWEELTGSTAVYQGNILESKK